MQANLLSTLSDAIRDAVDAIESWVSGFSAIDFVLAVAILWAAYWIWSALRAVTKLGPVEVALLDHDGEDGTKPEVNGLTGLFRERLATSGLSPPPEVPAGTPQTDLIAAVEASGHPQAAWVAKALELIPHPPRSPEYKVSGTVLKVADDVSEPRLRYWLQPKHSGRSVLDTVTADENEKAVCRAAAEIFLEISRDAVHVFPQWAQWNKQAAVVAYADGIEARLAEQDDTAKARFEAATAGQPANLLPRLQLANLAEKRAGMTGGGWEKVESQARVLRSYLDIGVARSDLVAARYRAAVLAGMLATDCEVDPVLHEQELRDVGEIVGLTRDDGSPVPPAEIASALHDLAAAEAKDAYQLVGRFQVLFDKHRLRHRYEPSGFERRRLRRTIAISRHTLRIRRLRNDPTPETQREVRRRKAVIRWVHLGLFRASAGWNAHYNAGCFYALLHDRELRLLNGQGEPPQEPGAADA